MTIPIQALYTINITVGEHPDNAGDTQVTTDHKFTVTFTAELGDLPYLSATSVLVSEFEISALKSRHLLVRTEIRETLLLLQSPLELTLCK